MKLNNTLNRLLALARREKFYEILEKTKRLNPNVTPNQDGYGEIHGEDAVNVVDIRIVNDEVLMDVEGHDIPMKGIPDDGMLRITAIYKRFIPLFLRRIKESGFLGRILIVLFLYFNWQIFSEWVKSVLDRENCYLQEKYYYKSTQELRRVLKKYFDESLVNAGTLIFQMDNAYRYRGQSLLLEIDQSKLTGYFETRKEILRVVDIYLSRDKDEQVAKKMRDAKHILSIALLIPKINKLFRTILTELDLDKIKFDEIDRYWVSLRKDGYNYKIC